MSTLFAQEMNATLTRLGISQREAAKRSHLSQKVLSNLCIGQKVEVGTLLRFAHALEIDPEPLLSAAGLSSSVAREAHSTPAKKLPLFELSKAAHWRTLLPASHDYYPLPNPTLAHTDFCVQMQGESMRPYLLPGDIVGVKAQTTALDGQLALVHYREKMTITRLQQHEQGWLLQPFNSQFPAINVASSEQRFSIIGVVCWHVHLWEGDDSQG